MRLLLALQEFWPVLYALPNFRNGPYGFTNQHLWDPNPLQRRAHRPGSASDKAKYKMKKEYPIRALEEIIILRPSSISTGAVQLALEAGVDIVYLNSFGTPVGRIFSSRPKGMAELRKAQVVFSSSPKTPGAFQDTRGRQGSLSVIE